MNTTTNEKLTTLAQKHLDAEKLEHLIQDHLDKTYNEDDIFWMSEDFLKNGYLKVSDIVSDTVKELFKEEVNTLFEKFSKRRDLLIESTGNTPRYLSNVRQVDIAEYGDIVPSIYHSKAFINFISKICSNQLIPNPWELEKFIINCQHKAGDTHGFHWGDYPISMIWIVESPSYEYGGILECVPHTYWNKKNPRVKEHILRNQVKSYSHKNGDIYLLKSDTTLHRVTPLEKDITRVIVNMAWEWEHAKDREVTHETFAFRD